MLVGLLSQKICATNSFGDRERIGNETRIYTGSGDNYRSVYYHQPVVHSLEDNERILYILYA